MNILQINEMNEEFKDEEITVEEMQTLLLWEDLIFLGIILIIVILAGSVWGLVKLFESIV